MASLVDYLGSEAETKFSVETAIQSRDGDGREAASLQAPTQLAEGTINDLIR